MIELMTVVALTAIVVGFAVPSAMRALKDFRLHSDASSLSSYINALRMRAASQYTPYRLDVDPTASTYVIEQLQPVAYNPLGTAASATYTSFSTASYEMGTQYFSQGVTVSNCLPASISTRPAPVTADPSSCSGTFQLYFNTRGSPVDNTGSSLSSGGVAVYLTNADGLVDAVTVSAGGAVQTWNWSVSASEWYAK